MNNTCLFAAGIFVNVFEENCDDNSNPKRGNNTTVT